MIARWITISVTGGDVMYMLVALVLASVARATKTKQLILRFCVRVAEVMLGFLDQTKMLVPEIQGIYIWLVQHPSQTIDHILLPCSMW